MATQVMGILNVTPDSFSDGGLYPSVDDAVAAGVAMLDHGAVVIDVGGESTRPGAAAVAPAAEIVRVEPVIARLAPLAAERGARVSIDTRHDEVARAAVAAGATILNDISASLSPLAAELGVGWIAMHMQGEPQTMQHEPHYDDVVGEVLDHLVEAARAARAEGVREVWIDPGIGFGKTFAHNWTLLAALDRFVDTGVPVVVGASRKAFLGAAMARADRTDGPVAATDRVEGSVAVATWACSLGVALLRCHDVRDTQHVVTVVGDSRSDSIVLPEVS